MATNSSFLPEDYLEKRIARRTNAICLTLFIVVMTGVVAAWFVTGRQYNEIRAQRTQVKNELIEKARLLEQVEELKRQQEMRKQKARITAALIEKIPRDRMLAELINHMPTTMGLLELQVKTETLRTRSRARTSLERQSQARNEPEPAVNIQPTEVQLSLVGLAPSDLEVAQFMTALSAHDLFQNVNLEFSEQTLVNEAPVRKFSIAMILNQDLDLSRVEKTMVARDLKQNPMSDEMEIDGRDALIRPAGDRVERKP